MMPPQPGYYYPPQYGNNMAPSVAAAPFYPGSQQPQGQNYNQGGPPPQAPPVQTTDPNAGSSTLVAQDVGGTVYFYDASQIPTYPTYPNYNAPAYAPNMAMGMSPAPEGYYYNQTAPGMPPY